MDYYFIVDEINKVFCVEECNSSDAYTEDKYHKVIHSLNKRGSYSLIGNVQHDLDYFQYYKDQGYIHDDSLFLRLLTEYNEGRIDGEQFIS